MFILGRGDLGGIESETFDFSQLEEYINDDSESNIYFHDPLVSSSELRVTGANDKPHYSQRHKDNSHPGTHISAAVEVTDTRGQAPVGHACVTQSEQQKNGFGRNGSITSSFTKPHHLPDSPPDSGSEPPFSPPNDDPKLRCSSIELLHQHHHLGDMSTEEALKHPYLGFAIPTKHIPDSSSSTSPTSTSSSPPHHHHSGPRHHSPVPASPVPVHSTHSTSMPVLATAAGSLTGQLITQIPQSILSPYISNSLQQQIIAAPGPHMNHLYTGGEEFLYDNLSSPVTSTTSNKKRKLPESPKQRNHHHNSVHVKTEPSAPSPDPSTTVLPSSEEDYGFDLSAADANALFVDSSYQCIRFQPFQQNTWSQLLDKDMKEIPSPQFRVDADKGFNFSNADESFVCQKKNHFQVTVHVQPTAEARYIRTSEGGTRPVEKFALHFHGVKMESPTQLIKVEQSQSDRSKRPFHPVPLEMVVDQVIKTTVGRLHFSETTSNNMRKKGKPNPDQRFFFLVVSLCAHVPGDSVPCTVIAYASEKIIVRASNPGQFENDMELSWQKGNTLDSIFHNGRVGINTDRPEEALVVHGNIKVTGHILQPSDLRAKYDIHELDTREQLRNVANLRIVRYRYLPELGDRLGIGVGLQDTGVIAQEVQDVIPEAVVEAGDLVLKDGKFIERLLVVNKERIFMENVGAVKELCKVTDNLETRIDELERINKKLSSIKRKDSMKSTSTDLSRVSSLTSSHGKRHCRHSCSKTASGNYASLCSSHFIQSTIIILVVIMACCLLALATLYIMEFQSRSERYSKRNYFIHFESSSFKNSTKSMQDKFTILTTLFPTAMLSRQETSSLTKTTPVMSSASSKMDPKPSIWTPLETSPDDPYSMSVDLDCMTEECPIYCCDPFEDDDDLLPIGQDDDAGIRHQHVEKKRSENVSLLDDTEVSKHQSHSTPHKQEIFNSTQQEPTQPQNLPHHKIKKRLSPQEEETIESNSVFMPDDSTGPMLHLLELNITLFPELCSKERAEGTAAEFMSCPIHISRHFPHPNVTLHISDEPDNVIQYCGSNHYTSCSGKVVQDEKGLSANGISKRDLLPQNHIWKLPVGSHFRSRYRFRIMSRQVMFATDNSMCSLSTNRPFTEYILTFQRRCDK